MDGEPYKEFTPDTDSYKLPDGDHTVTIAGTPDGWTMTPGMRSSQTPMPDGGFAIATTAEFAFAAPDGATVATYTFTWGMVEHTDDGETSDTPETPIVPDDDVDDNTDTSASDPGDKNTNGDTEANQSDQLPQPEPTSQASARSHWRCCAAERHSACSSATAHATEQNGRVGSPPQPYPGCGGEP